MEFNGDKICLKFSLEKTDVDFLYKIFFNFIPNKDSNSFETEQIQSKENNSLIKFNSYVICDYFFYKYQKVEIIVKKIKLSSSLRNYKIGDERMTLSTIISSKNCIFKTQISSNSEENIIIEVEKENSVNNKNISLFDYIKSGIQFKSFIAIDFSDEQYHILNEKKNQYLFSIKGFRTNLYEFTRLYEVYGFGNNFNNKKDDFFNFSKDENFCELNGYTNIYLAYMEILNQIKFDNEYISKGKKLSPLIKHLLNKIMNQQNPNYYNIIFILINSLNINEYKDCIDVFIQASFLPLSFVFIGIGENDNNFKLIKKLCDENEDNIDKKRIRNNTHFIAIKDFKENINKIQDEYLKKIPNQLCEFYFINNVGLNQIKERNINNNRNSLKVFDTYNSLIQQINSEDKSNNNAAPPFKEDIKKENINSNEQNKNKNEIIINNIKEKKVEQKNFININNKKYNNINNNNIIINIKNINNINKNNNKNNVIKLEINQNVKNKNRKNMYKKYESADNKITKKHVDLNLLKKFGINRTREPKEKINNHFKIESNKSTDITERKYRLVNNENQNNFN